MEKVTPAAEGEADGLCLPIDQKLFVEMFVRPHAAYHEASHAVVALAHGVRVGKVWINDAGVGCTVTESVPGDAYYLLRDMPMSKELAVKQRLGVLKVAGHVGNHLHEQWSFFERWPTDRQMGEWDRDWDTSSEFLVSSRYAAGKMTTNYHDDLTQAAEYASAVVFWRQKRFDKEAILPELLRYERIATRLLKKHWPAVEAIADKLRTSKSGKLTHARLMKLVGHHFQGAK